MLDEALKIITPEWRDITNEMSRETLLETFKLLAPWRIEEVVETRKRLGQATPWRIVFPRRIVDILLGLDSIFLTAGTENHSFGLDVTLNSLFVERKFEEKIQIFKTGAYSRLGIEKIGIIHLITSFDLPEKWWWYEMIPSQQRYFSYQLEERIYLMYESDDPVTVYKIKL